MNVAKEQSVIRVVRDERVGIPLGHYLPAESSDVFGCTGEYIEILNPSDQIESFSGLLNIGNILSSYCGERWHGSDAEEAVEFWTKQSSLRIGIGKIEIKVGREQRVAQLTDDMQSQVSRWRIPAISPIRLESPVVERGGSVFLVTLIESNREYERLLIGYQSLSGEKRLATGGEPQGASKRSNSDHRQRSNALLISLNVFPSAPDVGNGCFPKQYWAFLVGCLSASCFPMHCSNDGENALPMPTNAATRTKSVTNRHAICRPIKPSRLRPRRYCRSRDCCSGTSTPQRKWRFRPNYLGEGPQFTGHRP